MEKMLYESKTLRTAFFVGIGKAPNREPLIAIRKAAHHADREAHYRRLSTASVMSCVPTFVQPVSAR